MQYDFTTLSPDDFERLTADLLSAEWKVRVQEFKTGKDGGIDLRCTHPSTDTTTVVQCKHYTGDAFARLKRALINDELPKLAKLAPERYVVVTSVALSPSQKDALNEALAPWCKSSQDILGRDDINGLLRRHPSIERAHFKLWLASTQSLQYIINAGIFNQTAETIDELKTEISRFITHNGLPQAQEILEKHHHCLIVGVPGIGKTTLAKILLYQYTTQGYTPIVINSDAKEAWDTIKQATDEKIIILYDDFLGQVSLEESKLGKNEDTRLISLFKLASTKTNIRLLLTTREYILADAFRTHSRLEEHQSEFKQFTLSIEHYTTSAKARILFNHLYFSNLPLERIQSLIENKCHQKIVDHSNYNPRIIRAICESKNFHSLSTKDFPNAVLGFLDNPSEVWRHAFQNQIHINSQKILYLLWTFGRDADKATIKEQAKNLFKTEDDFLFEKEFYNCLRELEGCFIKTARLRRPNGNSDIIINFHNPSIRDFVSNEVNMRPNILNALSNAVSTYSQALNIHNTCIASNLRDALSLAERNSAQTCIDTAFNRNTSFFKSSGDYVQYETMTDALSRLLRVRKTTSDTNQSTQIDNQIKRIFNNPALLRNELKTSRMWELNDAINFIAPEEDEVHRQARDDLISKLTEVVKNGAIQTTDFETLSDLTSFSDCHSEDLIESLQSNIDADLINSTIQRLIDGLSKQSPPQPTNQWRRIEST